MSYIDDYKKMVEQVFVNPLNEFRTQAKSLDSIHQTHAQNFKHSISALLSPDSPLKGLAADALAEMVGNYLETELSLTSHTRDNLSELSDNTAHISEKAAAAVQHELDTMPFAHIDASTAAEGAFVAFIGGGQKVGLGELFFWTGLAAAGTTFIIVSGEQSATMDRINQIRDQWRDVDMINQGYAALAEPKLPPNPNNPHDPANDLGPILAELMMVPINQSSLSPQQEAWAEELAKEKEFSDLSLEEILDVIRSNPGGGSISFYRDRLRAYRSLRNWLQKKYGGKVALDIISAIILANPSLKRSEYDLLVELYEKQQPEQIPYNVVGVVRAFDGTIVYLTEAQLEHALKGHEAEFGFPDKGDFANMIMKLLQRKYDYTQGNRWVYKTKNRDIAIAIDTRTGMITTIFSVHK